MDFLISKKKNRLQLKKEELHDRFAFTPVEHGKMG